MWVIQHFTLKKCSGQLIWIIVSHLRISTCHLQDSCFLWQKFDPQKVNKCSSRVGLCSPLSYRIISLIIMKKSSPKFSQDVLQRSFPSVHLSDWCAFQICGRHQSIFSYWEKSFQYRFSGGFSFDPIWHTQLTPLFIYREKIIGQAPVSSSCPIFNKQWLPFWRIVSQYWLIHRISHKKSAWPISSPSAPYPAFLQPKYCDFNLVV